MTKTAPLTVEKVNQVVQHGADLGVIHLLTDNVALDGKMLQINGQKLINFSSCSYLGYEVDERLKLAAKSAIDQYGTQFSASRAFIAINLYEQVEEQLEKIFGYPTILAPTTTLGHFSNIPTFVSKNDAIILDHQVHASVRNVVAMVQARGTHTETIRHNNMENLEKRIKHLSKDHRKIWYMADGVYSMFGDVSPIKDIYSLLNRYDQFHLYIDDAHGMGWTGKNGAGYVLNNIPYHPKMVLITSLAKSFGSQGGAMVFHNKEAKQLVKNCGSSLMFSGPIAPAVLGASLESTKIHLSTELSIRQNQLKERINYAIKTAEAFDLPLVGNFETPICFIGVGTPDVCYNVCERMKNNGFLLSPSVYPSVPYFNSGLRFTITMHHSFDDIRMMLTTLSNQLKKALIEENYSKERIYKAFSKHGFFKNKEVAEVTTISTHSQRASLR